MYIENLKIACYAGSGVGKTVLMGHLIKAIGASNVGLISCEHGLNTIASLVEPENVKSCDSLADYIDAVKWASEKFPDKKQWVCVDGGSRIMQWLEQDTWGRAERMLQEKFSGATKPTDPEYAVYVTQNMAIDIGRVWSKLGSRAERLFNAFVKLPSSTYWTFWEQQPFIGKDQKGIKWTMDCPGEGTRRAAQSTMDFVFRLSRKNNRLVATFLNNEFQYGKRRDDWNAQIVVPDEIDGFDLADFVERVRGRGFSEGKK